MLIDEISSAIGPISQRSEMDHPMWSPHVQDSKTSYIMQSLLIQRGVQVIQSVDAVMLHCSFLFMSSSGALERTSCGEEFLVPYLERSYLPVSQQAIWRVSPVHGCNILLGMWCSIHKTRKRLLTTIFVKVIHHECSPATTKCWRWPRLALQINGGNILDSYR